MKAIGLTGGLSTACEDALSGKARALPGQLPEPGPPANPGDRLRDPALGAEVARADIQVREEAKHWLRLLQQAWASALGDGQLAWALIAQCVGALAVARMLASEDI